MQPIPMRPLVRFSSVLVVLTGLLLSSCNEDPPLAPPPRTLDDVALSLELDPASPLISEVITARLRVDGGDALPELSSAHIAWGWGSGSSYWFELVGRVEVEVQFTSLGEHAVRVRIQENGAERTLSQTVSVRGGEGDGSREMIACPAGPFLRGDDLSSFSFQRPRREIEQSAFALARTEMTNATCADAINWAVTHGLAATAPDPTFLIWTPVAGGPWQIVVDFSRSDFFWTGYGVSVASGRETAPVHGVTWAGAATVCNWLSQMEGLQECYTFTPSNPLHLYTVSCDFARDGYRLPTEAEWEKAARGGLTLPTGPNPNPGRVFPWGDDDLYFRLDRNLDGELPFPLELYGSTRANTRAPVYTGNPEDGSIFHTSLPVGSFPAGRGPYGHDDLIGNVAEWCWDWFGAGYYADSPDVDPRGPDAVYPGVDDFKVYRGDSWYGPYIQAMGAFSTDTGSAQRRWADYPVARNYIGFRLARSLVP